MKSGGALWFVQFWTTSSRSSKAMMLFLLIVTKPVKGVGPVTSTGVAVGVTGKTSDGSTRSIGGDGRATIVAISHEVGYRGIGGDVLDGLPGGQGARVKGVAFVTGEGEVYSRGNTTNILAGDRGSPTEVLFGNVGKRKGVVSFTDRKSVV